MAKTDKEINEVCFGIERIQEIMNKIRPNKRWYIEYIEEFKDNGEFDEWDRKYYGLLSGEEYVMVYELNDNGKHLLYACNVTGNSSLWTLKCLFDIIADKF